LLALALRLHGIHDPILDHPAWRQGDTPASPGTSRACSTISLRRRPTTTVPAQLRRARAADRSVPGATLYKTLGVHEIFGRLITLAFSLGTVAVLGLFGRWLFGTWIAGLGAAFVYAVMPEASITGERLLPTRPWCSS